MKNILMNNFAERGLLLLTLLSFVSLTQAQYRVERGGAGWQHLGSAHVDGRSDHDKIQVSGGTFNALQLGVTNGAIGFERLVVHFRNGQEEVLPVGSVVRSGGRSRNIPMRGGAREISNVEIWYQKGAQNEGRPRVDLFGRR